MQATSTGPYWGNAIIWGKILGYICKTYSYFYFIFLIQNHLCHSKFSVGRTTWGAVSTKLRRIASPAYADGKDTPRGGWKPDFQARKNITINLQFFGISFAVIFCPTSFTQCL